MCRHGQSDGNALLLCQGASPGYLTDLGKQQAHALGQQLFAGSESIRYDETWCSDLYRVRETCAIAHEAAGRGEVLSAVMYSSLLREKCAGEFEGAPRSAYYAALRAAPSGREFCSESGESWNDVQNRVRTFMDVLWQSWERDTPKDNGPKRILVFTSGGVIKEFINAFVYERLDDSAPEYPNCATNCSTFVFRLFSRSSRAEMIVENKAIVSSDRVSRFHK